MARGVPLRSDPHSLLEAHDPNPVLELVGDPPTAKQSLVEPRVPVHSLGKGPGCRSGATRPEPGPTPGWGPTSGWFGERPDSEARGPPVWSRAGAGSAENRGARRAWDLAVASMPLLWNGTQPHLRGPRLVAPLPATPEALGAGADGALLPVARPGLRGLFPGAARGGRAPGGALKYE